MAMDADIVKRAVDLAWSAGVALGRNFPCPLPDHTGDASLYCDPQSRVWKCRCWCRDEWWSLAEVCAAIHSGRARRLNDGSRSVWYRRLWHDAGLLEPVDVRFPVLAPDAPPMTHHVLDGLALLLGLRWLTHMSESAPFARAFAGEWCGIGEQTARKATLDLLERGTIRAVDEHVAGVRRTRLLLPGLVDVDVARSRP